MNILNKIENCLNEADDQKYNKNQVKKVITHLDKASDEIAKAAMEAAKFDVSKPYLSIKIQRNQVHDSTGDIQDIINKLIKDLKRLL